MIHPSGESLTTIESDFLRDAARFFAHPGKFAQGLNWVGVPIEYAQSKLPATARTMIARVSKVAIEKALTVAIKTVATESSVQSFEVSTLASKRSGRWHSGATAVMGGVGGMFGLLALPVELPASTIVMLRSIAEIARTYGHDITQPQTQLECLYVFSMGSPSAQDDAMESSYYTSRILFADLIKKASVFVAGAGAKELFSVLEKGGSPLLARLVTEIAAQFEIRVTKKMVAQLAPVVGAVGGAGINLLFTNYFQTCARFHFGVKRLEREHGEQVVRSTFERYFAEAKLT